MPATHVLAVVYTNQLCRQPGQGGDAETEPRDLRAELLAAEAAHFAKTKGLTEPTATSSSAAPKRLLETTPAEDGSECEDADAKRRRVLEETREIDADSDGADSESSEDSDDEEDETAELMRELEKIKRERAEQKAKEVCTSLANEDLQWGADGRAGSGEGCRRTRQTGRRHCVGQPSPQSKGVQRPAAVG